MHKCWLTVTESALKIALYWRVRAWVVTSTGTVTFYTICRYKYGYVHACKVVSLLLAVLQGTSPEFPTLCRKEREKNQFQASAETLKDFNLDAVDGTDVQGWNRAPQHSVTWSDLNVYIIRAYGDCQKEVNVLYTNVLPKIRQVMSSCAVNVQFRDLGSISRPLPEDRPADKRPPIGISLKSIKERNSVCIVLVGFDYGEPWKHTCGSETLKELGLDDSEKIEFAEEMSELEILATRAAQESEIKHTVFTSRMSVPRTFMYTCVDPDSPFRYQGGFSPTRSNFEILVTMPTQLCSFDAIVVQTVRCIAYGKRPDQGLTASFCVGRVGGASPGGGSPGANQRTDGFKKAVGGPADLAVHAAHGSSPVVCTCMRMQERSCACVCPCVHHKRHTRLSVQFCVYASS